MNVTTVIYHDTRRAKKNEKFPVKLRVTCNREQRYYRFPDKYDLTEEEYSKLWTHKPRKVYKEIQDVFTEARKKADRIIEKLGDKFSFALFEKMYIRKAGSTKDIFKLLEERSKQLDGEGRISTSVTFDCTKNSLKKFHNKNQLSIDAIDLTFLKNYQKWVVANGNSLTTVGIYTRNIRTIFNSAIADGIILKELYPFGTEKDKKFVIPTGRNIKKAISLKDIAAIYNYKPETTSEAKAKDFWLFSYLSNGINVKDIALLKFKNIDRDMIRFQRAKSKRSNRESPVISIHLLPELKRIINTWGNKSIYQGNYIFPILNLKMTAREEYNTIQLFVRFVNDHMKTVAKKLSLNINLTTYVARHSYSTIIRNSGKSIEFISEALGHADIKTTQSYLANFADDVKKEAAEELLNFSKVG